jgi:Fur family zinc uptake transcriptional regulator
MSAYAILDAVRGDKIAAPTTVYRALARLMERGDVHRLESINAYMACRHERHDQGQTVFAICSACGHVDELAMPDLAERLRTNAIQHGFRVDAAVIELTGRCASCARH